MRLIDADDLYDRCNRHSRNHHVEYWNNADEDIILDAINDSPTIDAEPIVHAEWEYDLETRSWRCDHCGWFENYPSPRCPYCGAIMSNK